MSWDLGFRVESTVTMFWTIKAINSILCFNIIASFYTLAEARGGTFTRTYSSLSANDILEKGIQALGGRAALNSVKSVSLHALFVLGSRQF